MWNLEFDTSDRGCVCHLQLKLVASAPRSADFDSSFKASHGVYHKYQMTIHNDKPDKPCEKQYKRFLVDSPLQVKKRLILFGICVFLCCLQVKLVQSSPESEAYKATSQLSAKLFAKYQMAVHKEEASDCGLDSFNDFLVKSPLEV